LVYSCITLDSIFYLKSSENWTKGNAACQQEASTNNHINENILLALAIPRNLRKEIIKEHTQICFTQQELMKADPNIIRMQSLQDILDFGH
jgi:hypothetical protein